LPYIAQQSNRARDRLAHVIEVILEHAEGYQDSGIDLETEARAAVKVTEPNDKGI